MATINWWYPTPSEKDKKQESTQKSNENIIIPETLYEDNDIPSWFEYVEKLEKPNEKENVVSKENDIEQEDSDITGYTLLDIGLCQKVQPLLYEEYVKDDYEGNEQSEDDVVLNDKLNEQIIAIEEQNEYARDYISYQKELLCLIDSSLKYIDESPTENDRYLIKSFINEYDEIWKEIRKLKKTYKDEKIVSVNRDYQQSADIIREHISELFNSEKYNKLTEKHTFSDTIAELENRIKEFIDADRKIPRPFSLYEEFVENLGTEYVLRRKLIACLSAYYKYDYSQVSHMAVMAIDDKAYEGYLSDAKKYILETTPLAVACYIADSCEMDSIRSNQYLLNYQHSFYRAGQYNIDLAIDEMRKLIRLIGRNIPGLERYKEKRKQKGCFGILVYGKHYKYFSFSGVHDSIDPDIIDFIGDEKYNKDLRSKINALINLGIKQYGYLKSFEWAFCTKNVKSYKLNANGKVQWEELGDVLKTKNIKTVKKDYSCCERKMLAFFENDISKGFNGPYPKKGYIFTKFSTCLNCKLAIRSFARARYKFDSISTYRKKGKTI